MKISIVIVNYKVRYYLQQCLSSLNNSLNEIDHEIFVVDNNSNDGSLEMLKEKFSNVNIIANEINLGFSKANNQAIDKCIGEYILILNPDTILQDDTIDKVLSFMDKDQEIGACGVKMLDGNGKFLPESKRGLPSPLASFYKLSGLSKLFPGSKHFGKYYLSHLDKNQTQQIEVLTGAFMCIRKSVIDKTAAFDESFFMYGEDIDLSYRILKVGYKVMYYPETSIIHYKGESTKKSSLKYTYLFYKAMHIFAHKHYSRSSVFGLSLLLRIAVMISGFSAACFQILKRFLIPLLDLGVIFGTLYGVQFFWAKQFIYPDGGSFPSEYITYFLPAYSIILWLTIYLFGAYDRNYSLKDLFSGFLTGSIFLLLIYAILPESMRYSRAVILISGLVLSLITPFYRWLLNPLGLNPQLIKRRRSIVIGSRSEFDRLLSTIPEVSNTEFIGYMDPKPKTRGLGSLDDLESIIDENAVNDLIFCQENISMQSMLQIMELSSPSQISYRMAPLSTDAIIGSQTILSFNDLFSSDLNTIKHPKNKRQKRLMDILLSLILLFSYPFQMFFIKKPFQLFVNIFKCLFGRQSWVGYSTPVNSDLPKLKQGILNISDYGNFNADADKRTFSMNFHYAKDYSIIKDLQIIFKAYRHLGRTP